MTILTLKEKMTGEVQSLLNGKIFVARKVDRHLQFIDLPTKRILVETSDVMFEKRTDTGIMFITSSGTTYDLLDVSKIIPTAENYQEKSQENKKSDNADDVVMDLKDLLVLDTNHNYKPIHYGDGYQLTKYKFNKSIDKETFIAYLTIIEKKKLRLEQEYPYQDYDEIIGNDDEWSIKRVLCYTD